jgi:hypothetical protein
MFVVIKLANCLNALQKDKNDNGPSITIAYLVINHVFLTNRNYETGILQY